MSIKIPKFTLYSKFTNKYKVDCEIEQITVLLFSQPSHVSKGLILTFSILKCVFDMDILRTIRNRNDNGTIIKFWKEFLQSFPELLCSNNKTSAYIRML